MTPSEFKAWFEGYSEALAGPPTAEQFAVICGKVRQIDERVKSAVLTRETARPRVMWADEPVDTTGTVAEQAAKLVA